jgi:hypothetical protein
MSHRTPAVLSSRPACTIEPLEDRRLMSVVTALASNTLFFFDTSAPDRTLAKVKVRGLAPGESLVGIDFRPSNGRLYGVGDSSRLYLINPTTGVAATVDPTGAPFAPPLAGTNFGIDFNPVPDRLRVVSDADVNFRLDPDTGAVVDIDGGTPGTQIDLSLAYVAGDPGFGTNPNVVALNYTRNVGGFTTPYGIDVDTNTMVLIGSPGGAPNSPNTGQLTTIGFLNVDPVAPVGFDVDFNGATDVGYASMATTTKERSTLYTVDLFSGAATPIGAIRASRRPVTDIAIVPRGNTVLAIDKKNGLFSFDSNLPNVALTRFKVNGLARKEKLLAIDVRPADGKIYTFTNQNRMYTIDPNTALATSVGGQTAVGLNAKAKAVDIDFDPVLDHARLVDNTNENLRLDPVTGQIIDADLVAADVQFDTPLVYASTDANVGATPNVSAIAFSNSQVGATDTTLFALDTGVDALVTLGTAGGSTSPSSGQLFTVGSLGVDLRSVGGFDSVPGATPGQNFAFAVAQAKGDKTSLHAIDLTTGAAAAVGLLPKGVKPISIAVLPGA